MVNEAGRAEGPRALKDWRRPSSWRFEHEVLGIRLQDVATENIRIRLRALSNLVTEFVRSVRFWLYVSSAIVLLQFCKERIIRDHHWTGLAGLVVLERNTAIRAAIIMEPSATCSVLFRVMFDVVQ